MSTVTPDRINLDGRSYLAYGFGDALKHALTQTNNAFSRDVIDTLQMISLDDYVPDYTSTLDFGPNRDMGIDWANAVLFLDGHDAGAGDLADVLLKDDSPFVQAIGANLHVFVDHNLCPTTHQDSRIVVRADGRTNFDDIDLNNILTWR